MKNKWFSFIKSHKDQKPDVILFPHAGAGASTFASWGKKFQACGFGFYPVQYPGRESRMSEPICTNIRELAEELILSDPELFRGDLIFYGKCLGALIAFAAAEAMEQHYHHSPRLLITSSGAAPEDMRLEMADSENIDALLLKYHFVTEIQLKDETFREYYLPTVRNDYILQSSFEDSGYLLSCDIMALYGKDDTRLTPEMLRRWQSHTKGNYTDHAFPGDHFFESQNILDEILFMIKR